MIKITKYDKKINYTSRKCKTDFNNKLSIHVFEAYKII